MPNIGGIYSGIKYETAAFTSIEQVNAIDNRLKELVSQKKDDSVVSIFMIPSSFLGDGMYPIQQQKTIDRPTSVAGYTPRNKKLLSYPYCFLTVDTVNDSHDYMFESGLNGKIGFNMVCAMSPNPEIVVYPVNYNGVASKNSVNPTESVSCAGFPQCAFTIDSYRAWIAQKAGGQILSTVGSAITAGVGAVGAAGAVAAGTAATAVAAPVAAGALGAIGLANSIYNMTKDSTQGSKTRGNQGSSTDVGLRVKGVYFKHMCVTRNYAEMIDSFFDRYGYSCCKIKVPNRNVRPYWTYTKTQNCSAKGNVPVSHMAKIKSIYDRGITFWNNGLNVGNYGLNNAV